MQKILKDFRNTFTLKQVSHFNLNSLIHIDYKQLGIDILLIISLMCYGSVPKVRAINFSTLLYYKHCFVIKLYFFISKIY